MKNILDENKIHFNNNDDDMKATIDYLSSNKGKKEHEYIILLSEQIVDYKIENYKINNEINNEINKNEINLDDSINLDDYANFYKQ